MKATYVIPIDGSFATAIRPKSHMTETEKVIRGFLSLENGWHFGEGVPPTQATIDLAIRLLRYGIQVGFTKSAAFPGISGEIQISFYRGAATAEIIVEANHTLSLFFERDGEEAPGNRGKRYEEAIDWLRQISGQLWNTCVFLVPSTLTQTRVDTRELLSGTLVTGPDPLRSMWAVQSMGAMHCARIFDTTTDPELVETRVSSGNFRRTYFPKVPA